MIDPGWHPSIGAAGLGAVVLLGGLLAATLAVVGVPRLRRVAGPTARRPTEGAPRASFDTVIVIPARNEAHVLDALLGDLAEQSIAASRVVVVDDASDDDTAAVARAWTGRLRGLEVRTAPRTPPSWNPKSWAMWHGVTEGTADAQETWLLFLDADVRLGRDALAALAAHAPDDGGLLSVAPRHDVGRMVETLSAVPNVVALVGAGGDRSHAAFGPCLLVSRHAYTAVGGHRSIAGDLLDDVALAARLRAAGRSVAVRRGGELVRYRMYPVGIRTIVEGWSKNLAAGATRVPWWRALLAAWWVTALLLPLWWLLGARTGTDVSVAAAAWAVVAFHSALLWRAVGRFGVAAAVAPLLAVAFVGLVLRSAFLLLSRRPVAWKGRQLVGSRTGGAPR